MFTPEPLYVFTSPHYTTGFLYESPSPSSSLVDGETGKS